MIKYFKDRKFKKLKQVVELISQYYCTKDGRNMLDKTDVIQAGKDIRSLGITDLKFKGNLVTIKLTGCGLLIGKRGENINKLGKFLSELYKKDIKIRIVEDKLMGWLEPVYFDEDYFNNF